MEDASSGQERRQANRSDVAFTLTYNVDMPFPLRIQSGFTDDIDAVMLNLSSVGVGIITKHNLPLGTKLFIKCNIIDLRLEGEERRRHMEIVGRVVSNLRLKDKGYRIGIRFDKISYADKRAIDNFVKSNKSLLNGKQDGDAGLEEKEGK